MFTHLRLALMVASSIIVMVVPSAAQLTSGPIDTSPPSGFEENKGQISDQFGRARPDVRFSFVQKGFRMRLLRNGVAYELTQSSRVVDGDVHRPFGVDEDVHRPFKTPVEVHRVDVGFAGAAAMPRIETGEVLDGYANYYYAHLPESGATFVRSYASITYRDLYEGVDMVVHTLASLDGSTWPVSTDFVVRAGADPAQIRIRYEGARDVRVTAAGELEITTDLGTIREQAPVCRAQLPTGGYVNVGGRFRLDEGEVSFALDAYPTGAILTIDPGLVWATYYGGTGDDRFNDVSSDLSGAVYAAGSTESATSIATIGAFKTVYGGSRDAMLVKLRANGTRIWSTYAGGSGDELGHAIATTPGGQVFICGYTTSTTGIATTGSMQTTYAGSEDAFVMRFDSAGVRVFGTYLGGDDQDIALGISLLGTSGIYITGSTQSVTGIATPGAFKSTHAGSDMDAFLCLLSWPGSVKIWSTYYGGSSTDFANDVDTDASGNPVMVGRSHSPSGIASPGAHDTTLNVSDGFIARFSSTGSRSWATYFGGNAGDEIEAVDVSTSGTIHICGRTSSPDAIGTPGTHMPTFAGSASPISMLAAFSSTGTRQWGTYFLGDGCTNIVASGTALYMCGGTRINTGITTADALQPNNAGYGDGYLISFSLNGTRNWGTFFGGTDEDDFRSLTLIGGGSNAGDIVCCGLTESTGLSSTPAHQSVGGGKIDGLLTCLRDISITVPALVTTTLCKGSILQVSYTAAGVYASSNIFRAQLSNNAGSFSSGITEIGQRTATSSGTIMGSVPLSPPSTGGYKIRVTSSDPVAYSQPIPATFTLHPTDTSGVTWTGSTSTAWAQLGNWANPCTLPGPGDTVRIPQTTRAPVTAAAVTIGAIELANSGGLTLGGDLTVSNKLTLTRGALTLGAHNLVLGTFATIVGGGDSALVVTNSTGRMRSSGRVVTRTQFVDFPIGPSLGSYNPLHIINDGTGDEFLARVQSGVTTTGGSGGTPITTDIVGRTWHLAEAVPGGSLLALEFTWKNTHELTSFDRRNCFVARHDGRDWVPVSGLDRATGTNPYTRSALGLTVTGPFAIGDIQSVIPVELVLFTVRVDGEDVVLAWETADERSNAGFEVQRARVDDDAWTVVSFVAARAAEGSGAKYEMVDRSVAAGTWRYRLRQVDVDGRAEYSQAVTVVVGDENAVPLVAVHPNPARDVAQVVVRDARVVVLRDVLGRAVWRADVAGGGVQTLVVPAQFMPAGVYIVETELARTLLRIVR